MRTEDPYRVGPSTTATRRARNPRRADSASTPAACAANPECELTASGGLLTSYDELARRQSRGDDDDHHHSVMAAAEERSIGPYKLVARLGAQSGNWHRLLSFELESAPSANLALLVQVQPNGQPESPERRLSGAATNWSSRPQPVIRLMAG